MSKLSKAESARINGAKSKGPVTPEGKERSSKNALRHGLAVEHYPLMNESRDRFAEMLANYVEAFQPANQVEEDLVEDMVDARWRKRRAVCIYNSTIDLQMYRDRPALEKQFSKMDGTTRQAIAMAHLSEKSEVLRNLHRYQTSAVREYHRALSALRSLQAERRAAEPPPQEAPAPAEKEKPNPPAAQPLPRPKLVPIDEKIAQNEPTAPSSDDPKKETI